MVIFHSYIELPEGSCWKLRILYGIWPWPWVAHQVFPVVGWNDESPVVGDLELQPLYRYDKISRLEAALVLFCIRPNEHFNFRCSELVSNIFQLLILVNHKSIFFWGGSSTIYGWFSIHWNIHFDWIYQLVMFDYRRVPFFLANKRWGKDLLLRNSAGSGATPS